MKYSVIIIKKYLFNILFDVGSMFACLTILSLIKYSDKFEKLIDFNIIFGSYALLILIFSVVFDKYELKRRYGFYKIFNKYLYSWLLTSAIIITAVLFDKLNYYQWEYILICFVCLFVFEIILISIRFSYRYAKFVGERLELRHSIIMKKSFLDEQTIDDIANEEMFEASIHGPDFLKELIPFEAIKNIEVKKFIERNSSKNEKFHAYVNTFNRQLFFPYKNHSLEFIVNTCKINHVRYINKFLEIINIKLKRGGKLIVCFETLDQRRNRHNKKYPRLIMPFYVFFDFLVHRVWPRLPFFRKTYYWFWLNNSKRISYAEILGRMYSCGFEYVDEVVSEGQTWMVIRKKEHPLLSFDVTYSPVIKLKRIGKGGKIIDVYKMRTMHPYSEFLQDYIYNTSKLKEGGKFKDDFRVTSIGKFVRRFWLDELPMIYNFLRGELKIVGVRPLSKHYFNLYPSEIQKKRIKYKPGLIPPFYVDLPKSFDEIIASETRYLEKYEKDPFNTDIYYFLKATWNIIFKNARSE